MHFMKKSNKAKALFILHYSPPIHGAAKVGDTIRDSKVLKSNFETRFIKIKASESLETIGQFKFKKVIDSVILFLKIAIQLIRFRPHKIYFTASPFGFAFYRDLCLVIPIKIYTSLSSCHVFYHYHAKGIKAFTSKDGINKKLTNFFVSNTSLIFISKMMSSELINVKRHKRILFLKNGVDDTLDKITFAELLNSRFKKSKIKVLYLSNMIKTKGYDTVLELAIKVKNENLNVEFNFAGAWASKEEEEFFYSFVNAHNLKNIVKYHGLVLSDEKEKLFKESNLFIFPSRYSKEVFPLSLLEALSYGLPILVFDVGAVSEIVSKDVGVISSKNELFNSFKKMQNKYFNKEVSLACRKRFLENYTTEVFEKNLVAILKLENERSDK
jgi:glycosyltransferase involved in cell wall biosynthesis